MIKVLESKRRMLANDVVECKQHTHECSHAYCNPMMVDYDTYMCRYLALHKCTEQLCKSERDVCPISGRTHGPPGGFSSYDKDDFRTWKAEVVSSATSAPLARVKRARTRIVKPETVFKQIEAIVEKLLYSGYRKKIVDKWRIHQGKKCQRKIDSANKQYPFNRIRERILRDYYKQKTPPLQLLKYDANLVAKYAQRVFHTYEVIRKCDGEQNKICVESVTLATLYMMRFGYRVNDVVLLPLDAFLVQTLPEMNDLPGFGLEKSRFTKGQKLINFAFDMAFQKLPMEEIVLND
jgi:hypothetical protein